MKIALIGDYLSIEYKSELGVLRSELRDDHIEDLGRHNTGNWKKDFDRRCADIDDSRQVIVLHDWSYYFDAKADITYSQKMKKEMFVLFDGKLFPWDVYYARK